MTKWTDIKGWVHDNFEVVNDLEIEFEVKCRFEDGRDQNVMIRLIPEINDLDHPWVSIESIVGKADEVNLPKALMYVGVGGLGLAFGPGNEFLMVRHALSEEDADKSEFLRVVRLIAKAGDNMERMFTRGDQY